MFAPADPKPSIGTVMMLCPTATLRSTTKSSWKGCTVGFETPRLETGPTATIDGIWILYPKNAGPKKTSEM